MRAASRVWTARTSIPSATDGVVADRGRGFEGDLDGARGDGSGTPYAIGLKQEDTAPEAMAPVNCTEAFELDSSCTISYLHFGHIVRWYHQS